MAPARATSALGTLPHPAPAARWIPRGRVPAVLLVIALALVGPLVARAAAGARDDQLRTGAVTARQDAAEAVALTVPDEVRLELSRPGRGSDQLVVASGIGVVAAAVAFVVVSGVRRPALDHGPPRPAQSRAPPRT